MNPPLPQDVIDVLRSTVETTFQEVLETWIVPDDSSIDDLGGLGCSIFAEIILKRAHPGRLILGFPEPVLRELANRYLQGQASLTHELICDVAGELCNIITGQVKTNLKGSEYHFNLSTPIIHPSQPFDREDGHIIRFTCDLGSFLLFVDLVAGSD